MLSVGAICLVLEPRIALVLFLLLLLAAAAPIVMGWIAILPEEREPFAGPDEFPRKKPRDAFAIFLLVNISLSVLMRIPVLDGGKCAHGHYDLVRLRSGTCRGLFRSACQPYPPAIAHWRSAGTSLVAGRAVASGGDYGKPVNGFS
jgi:hypothetical protein